MKQKITLSILSFTLLLALSTNAQTLITDTLFGINGVVSAPSNGWPEISKMLRQPDNKIILCGNTYNDAGCNCYYNDMLRVDACGNVDSTFGINGFVHHKFDQRNIGAYYELQADGKILVSGVQSDGNSGSQQFPFIARYKSNGTPDSTFGTNGTNKINYLGPGIFSAIYLMDSGKILCTGSPNGGSNLIIRFDSTGAVDNTFGAGGVVQHSVPPGVNFFYDFKSVMRSDGKIVSVAPAYLGINNDKNVVLSCFDTLGVIDSTFGTNGFYIDYNFVIGNGLRLALQSDDKLIVAQQNLPETAIIVARYNTNGSLDTTYGVNGYINIPAPNSPSRLQFLTKFNDDKILIGYQENGVIPVFKKFDINGVEDPNFSLNGSTSFEFTNTDKARNAIVSVNDELLMGGCGTAFSMTSFILNSSVPHITQSGNTLFPNVPNNGCTYQWFNNGNAISGATDSIFTITASGIYSVEVANSLGCKKTDEFSATFISGINAIEINSASLYPNPTSNIVTVQFSKSVAHTTISMIDVLGKKVFEKQYNNISSAKIDISSLTDGIYSVNILNEDGSNQNFKIVKIK